VGQHINRELHLGEILTMMGSEVAGLRHVNDARAPIPKPHATGPAVD
jgi:hypothetical protein